MLARMRSISILHLILLFLPFETVCFLRTQQVAYDLGLDQSLSINPLPNFSNPVTTKAPEIENFLGPPECLEKGLTRESCGLVFCLPWQRCLHGRCSCKPPNMCPTKNVTQVCGRDDRKYLSFCQLMALSCFTKRPEFSHFGETCEGNPRFSTSIYPNTGAVQVFVPNSSSGEEMLICWKKWNMAAANVACKEKGYPLGAANISFIQFKKLRNSSAQNFPTDCAVIKCQGYETSLAECVIHRKEILKPEWKKVATVTCYNESQALEGEECGFRCVNTKCVSLSQTCDGVDDCGDRSDEMCCERCRGNSFRCKTGVCLHADSLVDNQMDCLDGEDEKIKSNFSTRSGGSNRHPSNPDYVSPQQETTTSRLHLESKLSCGIPNMDIVNDEVVDDRAIVTRVKRVVGGIPSKPTQIQWQVAVEENGKIDCGGAYIGGCWVLTAAHCVRPKPSAFWIKFSLWKKSRAQGTTDIVPVQEIHIHPSYDASTYENDIALIQLKTFPFEERCVDENPAIRAVCVPWSPHLFQANHTCSISGWGRTAAGRGSQYLLWANVSLISNCERFYANRFHPGMMCAGDLDGSVDSCQGDSGGPLVCQDELGVSYLWGIVSWGEQCGKAGFPGVYTQVADYFEWIRSITGWSAITKFNA